MAVRPLDLATLPRVTGGDLAAARRAAVRFGALPRSVELTVARFGRVSLSFRGVVHAARPAPDQSVWRLRRPGAAPSDGQGWLLLGHATGLRVVSALLGLPGPRVHRPLGTTERGILAAAISAVIRHAPGVALAGARPEEWSGSGLARVEGWAESEMFREAFFLDLPPSWVPDCRQAPLAGGLRVRGLWVALTVEVARTTITAEEWSRARPGDAVVFDRPARRESAPLPVLVVCGRFAAPALITTGELRVTDDFSAHDAPERTPMADDPDRDITTTVLAAAPIEIVAELARVTLAAEEVSALKAGAVLALPPRSEARIELKIGDRSWAQGELVDLDGQLAVRLTRLTQSLAPGAASDADTLR